MDGKDDKPGPAGEASGEEGWEAGRTSALYDPDTVYRGPEAAVRNGLATGVAPLVDDKDVSPTGPSIYAKGEKKRGAVRMTKSMTARIFNELDQAARKTREPDRS